MCEVSQESIGNTLKYGAKNLPISTKKCEPATLFVLIFAGT